MMLNLVSLALAVALAAAPTPVPKRRMAVVVGANQAVAGRSPLRYSFSDAQSMARVLEEAGQFAPSDVKVLLDPKPETVLRALDDSLAAAERASGETMLFFYYSGHADDRALYPHGEPLPFEALKQRLERPSVTVRIGVIDTCRGGAWTRSKALKSDAPFEVPVPFQLESEGSVLIASSSGLESAHEAESLRGSFFTHHFVAGLRGAADQSGDGEITVGEAFAYAQRLTVRDTALQAESPQHPSFDMNLHGRQDLVLTRVAASQSVLSLAQTSGPLELIQIQTGLVILELPPGKRAVRLAVPPGTYLVRRRSSEGVWAREVMVVPNQSTVVAEESLELVGNASLRTKEMPGEPAATRTTAARNNFEFRVVLGKDGIGLSDGLKPTWSNFGQVSPSPGGNTSLGRFLHGNAFFGITDRLQIDAMAGITYRMGERGSIEWVPWLGLIQRGGEDQSLGLGAGLGARFWFSESQSLNVSLSSATYQSDSFPAQLAVGFSQTWEGTWLGSWTVNLSVSGNRHFTSHPESFPTTPGWAVGLGSVMVIGRRMLPLVQFHLTPTASIDGYAVAMRFVQPYGGQWDLALGTTVDF